MSMSDPGFDNTAMTPEEFEACMAEGTPADISPTPPESLFIVTNMEAPRTGSRSVTRREQVQLAGDRTIREYRAFADT